MRSQGHRGEDPRLLARARIVARLRVRTESREAGARQQRALTIEWPVVRLGQGLERGLELLQRTSWLAGPMVLAARRPRSGLERCEFCVPALCLPEVRSAV